MPKYSEMIYEVFDVDISSHKPVNWSVENVYGEDDDGSYLVGISHSAVVVDRNGNELKLILTWINTSDTKRKPGLQGIDLLYIDFAQVPTGLKKLVSKDDESDFKMTNKFNAHETFNILQTEAVKKIKKHSWTPDCILLRVNRAGDKPDKRLRLYDMLAARLGNRVGCNYHDKLDYPDHNIMAAICCNKPITPELIDFILQYSGKRQIDNGKMQRYVKK